MQIRHINIKVALDHSVLCNNISHEFAWTLFNWKYSLFLFKPNQAHYESCHVYSLLRTTPEFSHLPCTAALFEFVKLPYAECER